MALNLSTLTSPATSGDVLAEALTTADFLEPVPVLRNLARGSQKGGDAKQDVALNQPKALPLIDGDGYLYLSGVANNHAYVPSLGYGSSDDHSYYARCYISSSSPGNFYIVSTRVDLIGGLSLFVRTNVDTFSIIVGSTDGFTGDASSIPRDQEFGFLITYNGSTNKVSVYIDNVTLVDDLTLNVASWNSTTPFFIGARGTNTTDYTQSTLNALGYIKQAKAFSSVVTPPTVATATPSLNVDFTVTNVRHGDTKFKCATGQVVTINQSGNDPATIIKKPVLRFDGANSGLNGLFANNIDGGYMFAAFSVLGDGGADWGRVFTTNLVGSGTDYSGAGAGFSLRSADTTNLLTITQGLSQSMGGMFDAANGDILHEVKLEGSDFSSKVNNAGFLSATHSNTIDSDRFNIGQDFTQFVTQNGAIDLEFLALFSADSVPDEATASKIRNYINNRNNVFDLKDGFGYYFYDAQNAPVGNISSGSASWNGRIVGSDNGDTDKLATQATANDQPVGDGYVVNFADNTDHLEIPQVTLASGDSYAWMVCGTSLGTFAYKVTVSGQTELTLLGHLGNATYRQAGDLYGIILLPESATGADIEAARKLLIDRGAADGATLTSYFAAWVARSDIVEFKNINFGSATNFGSAWENTGLTSFDTPLPSATDVRFAWYGCTSLSDFRTTDIKNCTNFTGAFQGTSSLQQFPAGAKLGTEANNVNFTSAWQSSGLTSFPALDLSNGNIFTSAWKSCTSLTSFPAGAKLGTAASNVNMANAWQDASLTSFPLLDLSSATNFAYTWRGNDLTSFPKIDVSNGSVFINTWRFNQSLTDFPAGLFDTWNPSSINNTVFTDAWDGCTSLTAQSVENILVSIDASGQYATRDGNSGSIAITDAGIDIDYNTATGSLSAATNSAVTSLKAKGWSIIVNNVTL